MFGKQNMLIVDNSEGKDFKVETLRAYKDVTKFLKKPIENSLAKRWIKTQTKKKS
jgi:hypothetical protein